jgi:hypothetical protein
MRDEDEDERQPRLVVEAGGGAYLFRFAKLSFFSPPLFQFLTSFSHYYFGLCFCVIKYLSSESSNLINQIDTS